MIRPVLLLFLLIFPLAAANAAENEGSRPQPLPLADLDSALTSGPGKKPAARAPLQASGPAAGQGQSKIADKFSPAPAAAETGKTELDVSFDDGDDARPLDGGLNKDNSSAAVGLRHDFSGNWSLGGGALFQGRGRGAAANLGFTW